MSGAARVAAASQREASDPVVSAWVDASAGSGKTKVLTDRVLRLLLVPGQEPGRLLCLTFTKAAAAEMANRLNRRLGEWAVADAAGLAASLTELTGTVPNAATLTRARSLFATVLDLPGGMRISTIHAFAQGLLRGFPIEAQLPPRFRVAETVEQTALTAAAREQALAVGAGPVEALAFLAGETDSRGLDDALRTALSRRDGLPADTVAAAALSRALAEWAGVDPDADEEAVRCRACAPPDSLLRIALMKARTKPDGSDAKRGLAMSAWLALPEVPRRARFEEWRDVFLTQKLEAKAERNLATKGGLGANHQEVLEAMQAEAARLAGIEAECAGHRLRAASLAFAALAVPIRDAYRAQKRRAGLLDYDDLIAAAEALLRDPGSAWVLFRLDGGLDHLLLDESQDTNRAQWAIAGALAGEFFTGQGSRDRIRTVFAVGDPKQSIYAFQGADPAGFERERRRFARDVAAAGQTFATVPLNVSFRSTPPVLALVDAVFAAPEAAEGVVAPTHSLRHVADRAGQAGEVELWPLFRRQPVAEAEAWIVPDTPVSAPDAAAECAEAIAARIAGMIAAERLPARDRPIRAGDVLVLVQKRYKPFLAALTAALKARGVPVGGVDRLALTEQIAVVDLLALCDVLLLPEDDLSLAAVLKSPLVGLDEERLFTLAHGRLGSLWAALMAHRAGAGPLGAAADWLAGVAARAAGATPHSLLAGLLAEDGGRARLLARLGPEAADPLDELLNAALADERRHPPDLQGFLHRLRAGGAEVKREAESGADAVRIMTVHNAKGLQAPIVFLPDVGPGQGREVLAFAQHRGMTLPLFTPRRPEARKIPAFEALVQAEAQARAEEDNRLLYVALTRAEDRLIVCGWQRKSAPGWHAKVAAGFDRLAGVEDAPFPHGPPGSDTGGLPLRRLVTPQIAEPRRAAVATPGGAAHTLPLWAAIPAAPEARADPLSPSGLPGEEETPAAAPHGRADPRGERFRRGRLVHALLQHLPDLPAAGRAAAGATWLARQGLGARMEEGVLAEAMAILDHPQLREVFGPGSLAEAPIVGRIGDRLLSGQVDRLLVTPDRVVVLDYKTNRPPPESPAQVAPLYLRQMAAYRTLLRQTFPGRRVEAWLVWTYAARPMALPDALLDAVR
ncbi:DNA helicase/exodeoxyribonuclease V subunit A [Humitalea rosea]|uniref:DNA 3'-5' helicase n=1 Tax=Humitalea rosea TaxID=990373 RepID=A0A2W7J1N7_9PROT|nr:double-strand break repair helicase AddA [Humitalea rosea]PZW44883.1 DNA helicase/exodeoxyribonuclease V subunit A [Humitalea rosea]